MLHYPKSITVCSRDANIPAFYYGTSPNKFFDYIAAELPILNNYPGWLADLISQYKCGLVVPPEDPVAFADALEKGEKDGSLLKKMGKKGGAMAEARFNRVTLSDQWVDVLECVWTENLRAAN